MSSSALEKKLNMVTFVECEAFATNDEVDQLEKMLGFAVPLGLRKIFTTANGGRPEPDIFKTKEVFTNVSQCLALNQKRGGIWWTYELLVLKKKAMPLHFVPFANDSGGNTFVVDCSSDKEQVHILLYDPVFELVSLEVGFDEFWLCLENW
jgi:hypothetical protein